MKNFIQFLALAGLVTAVSCDEQSPQKNKGMQMGNLYVSQAKPQPGEQINVKYSGDFDEETEATVNFLVNSSHYPVDLELKDSAGNRYGNLQIPDSIQAIAFNFKNGDVYEANDRKGYVIPLYNENSEMVDGASAAMGSYYINRSDRFNIKMEADSALAMIDKDLKKNPALIPDHESSYSRALMKADRKKGTDYIDDRIAKYLKKDSLSGKDYDALVDLYYNRGAEKKADSISNIAVENFPNSDLGQRDLMMKAVRAKDQEEKIAYFEKFEELDGANKDYRDVIIRYIAMGFSSENNWEQFQEYLDKMDDPLSKAGMYNSSAWDLAEKGKDLEKAVDLSKKSLKITKESSGQYAGKPDYFSNNQFDKMLRAQESMYADTYAFILFQQGKLEEAIEVQEKAITKESGPDMTTRYVEYLVAAEKYKKAQEKAEQFIVENRANSEMTEYLKTAYTKNKNAREFDTFYAGLEEKAVEKAKNDLEKIMINEEAPDFELTDLSGNKVQLSALKGKTVILDFWATWCGPCKMSFPGMQKAIDKYGNEKNVEFLFVNTWETGEDRNKIVSEFIEKNNYDFHVIMDNPVEEGSSDFNVVSDYGVNGIPTKIIIGPDGKINFKKVGFTGNNEKMLKEIGIMIELTQKNKQPEV